LEYTKERTAQKEGRMKAFAFYGMISLTVALFVFASGPAASHEGHGPAEKVIFTKHFQDSLFDVTEHAMYSLEVLLDDNEYKIGKDMVGIVVHDKKDSDVIGAELTIVHKSLATGETVPGKLTVTDKGNGLYVVSGLDLKRDGKWELLITVRKAGVEDSVKFIFPDVLKNRPAKGRYSP
jgi:hypothetical protein